jgi:hypothetical protein
MLFYHACMRYTLVNNIKSYLAIYDLPPLNAFQRLGEPFRTYPNLQPRPYGGPFDTIPAFSIVNELIQKIKNKRQEVIAAFILGTYIDEFALLPGDFDSSYSINDKTIRKTVAELII